MGNPFLFADRFSGAVVHLTTGGSDSADCCKIKNARDSFTDAGIS
jgi:hypothetical protein